MISLKAVLVGTSCVGALAIGGGVTYTTVSNPTDDLPAKAAVPAQPAVPAAPPQADCLRQAAPDVQGKAGEVQKQAQSGAETLKQQAQSGAQSVPQAGAGQAAPAQPKTLPKGLPENGTKPAPGVPGTDCVKQGVPSKPNLPAAPEAPQLPNAPGLSCDSMQAAIPHGSQLEQAAILSRGLGEATKHASTIQYQGKKLCAVTQKWTAKGGQFLQVERFQAPKGLSAQQLRDMVNAPAPSVGSIPTNANGLQGYQSPVGGVMIGYAPDGVGLYVSGTQLYSTVVTEVATKLQTVWSATDKVQDAQRQGTDTLQHVR
jgi:hypothetical protein